MRTGTSGGSVNLSGLACSLDTYTSGGSINAELSQLGKFVKIDASSGHVNLRLPKSGMNLNVHGNRVTADFSGNFDGTKDKDRIEGKLNGGGVPIDVNGGGRVTLTMN